MSSRELILDRWCQECRFEREDEFYRIMCFKKQNTLARTFPMFPSCGRMCTCLVVPVKWNRALIQTSSIANSKRIIPPALHVKNIASTTTVETILSFVILTIVELHAARFEDACTIWSPVVDIACHGGVSASFQAVCLDALLSWFAYALQAISIFAENFWVEFDLINKRSKI